MSPPASTHRPLSPVLLIGAGTGEATCGILYLAGYLRRNGIEAFVRLWDGDETEEEIAQSLEAVIARVRPRFVGISLKWFHHVHRALLLARLLKKIDPTIRVAVGGNSASYWWRELSAFDCFDHIVFGDGEVPLLALCQGDPSPPNCVTRDPDGSPRRLPLKYVQGTKNTEDIYYSHFRELFLSQMDLHAFSGWVAPGKGCAENCLYCGGARGNQKAAFGRAKPFLRSEESVQRDHREIAPHTWELRYDFSGSSAEFLQSTWAGTDLSRHACTYFLWGVPRLELIAALASTFQKVFMVLDTGCFSETQRLEQMRRGLLKPCATDKELLELIGECRKFKNLDIEISGIAGLPFASEKTLDEERKLVERVTDLDCVIGYQRLEAQPGALVTEHPARFEMHTEAKTFQEFVDYFEAREVGDNSVPMIRFNDEGLEEAVQQNADEISEFAREHEAQRRQIRITPKTRLANTAPYKADYALSEWFGSHRVPKNVASEKATVVRSENGATLVCTPTVSPRRFADPTLAQGKDAEILLGTLAAFEKPNTVATAAKQLGNKLRLDEDSACEVIDHLVHGRFLQPV